jgi:hypothetical protein
VREVAGFVSEQESCRPDFAVAIYPGHLSLHAAEWDAKQGTKKFVIPHLEHQSITNAYLALNPDLHVTSRTPPTFLLQAEDDHVEAYTIRRLTSLPCRRPGFLRRCICIRTGVMHLGCGGHAFGLRRTKLAITEWPQLVETWVKTIGIRISADSCSNNRPLRKSASAI